MEPISVRRLNVDIKPMVAGNGIVLDKTVLPMYPIIQVGGKYLFTYQNPVNLIESIPTDKLMYLQKELMYYWRIANLLPCPKGYSFIVNEENIILDDHHLIQFVGLY